MKISKAIIAFVLAAAFSAAESRPSHLRKNKNKESFKNEMLERKMRGSDLTTPELPYSAQCQLGSAIEIKRGCRSNPIDMGSIEDCTSSNQNNAPCYAVSHYDGSGQTYTQTVMNNDHVENLINSVSTAEGSFCGFSLSASVDYIEKSSMDSESDGSSRKPARSRSVYCGSLTIWGAMA